MGTTLLGTSRGWCSALIDGDALGLGKWNIAVHVIQDVSGSHLEYQVFKWWDPLGGFPIPDHPWSHLE